MAMLLGLVALPLTLFLGFGAAVAAVDGTLSARDSGSSVLVLALFGTVSITLVSSAVGLLLPKPWGWWASVVIFGFFFLMKLKYVRVLLDVRWEHPRAGELAREILVVHALPCLLALAMLVLLLLPGMRLAYGVKQAELRRPRGAVPSRPHR